MPETWWKIEDLAEHTGFSRYQLYRRIQSGQLPATLDRTGKLKYLVRDSDVQRYLVPAQEGGEVGIPERAGEMLRIPDVAAMLGFTAETVRRMCDRGDLSHVRGSGPRGHYRIARTAVDEYLTKLNK
jgi:excisionase family DNA binding protein